MLANRHPNLRGQADGATRTVRGGHALRVLSSGPAAAEPPRRSAMCSTPDPRRPRAASHSRTLAEVVGKVLASSTVEAGASRSTRPAGRAREGLRLAHAPRFRESWETYPSTASPSFVKVKECPGDSPRHLIEKYADRPDRGGELTSESPSPARAGGHRPSSRPAPRHPGAYLASPQAAPLARAQRAEAR